MEELKSIFGESALTYDQFSEALNNADKKTINLANLAKGGYVAKDKFTTKKPSLQPLRTLSANYRTLLRSGTV